MSSSHVSFKVDGPFEKDDGFTPGFHRDNLDTDHDVARLAKPEDNMVFGIGIIFMFEPCPPQLSLNSGVNTKDACIIKQIVQGGSADREGTLRQGDVIVLVAGEPAGTMSAQEIKDAFKGPSGTAVNLEWAKPDGRSGAIRMPRGNAGYWALKDQSDALVWKVQEVEKELSDARDKASRHQTYLNAEIADLKKEITLKERERLDETVKTQKAEELMNVAINENAAYLRQIGTLKQSLSSLQNQVHDMATSLADKSHEIAEAALRIQQCENEKSLAERAKMSEEMRADALQHELDELKKANAKVIADLSASHLTQITTLKLALQKAMDEVVEKEKETLEHEHEVNKCKLHTHAAQTAQQTAEKTAGKLRENISKLEGLLAEQAEQIQMMAREPPLRIAAETREKRAEELYLTEVNTHKTFEIETLVLLDASRAQAADALAKAALESEQCANTRAELKQAQQTAVHAQKDVLTARAKIEAVEKTSYEEAAKARTLSLEVKSVQGQLLTAERSGQTAVKDMAQLSQKIVALEKELKVLLNEHQVHTKKCEPLVAKAHSVEPLKEEITRLRLLIEEADFKLGKAMSDASIGPSLLAAANMELSVMRTKIANLQSEVRSEKEVKTGFMGDVDQLTALVASLQERHVMLQTKMEDSQSRNRILTSENESVRTIIQDLEKLNAAANSREMTLQERIQREGLEKQSMERKYQQAVSATADLAQEVEAANLRLHQSQDTRMELEIQLSHHEAHAKTELLLKERVNVLVSQNSDLNDSVGALRADNSRLEAAEKRVRAELSEAVVTVERLNTDMNQLKLVHGLKLAGMARRIDEDVHFLMQERDQLQAELERYYGLPNPCGVGMIVEDGITKLDTGRSSRVLMVTGLVPGLAAELSLVVRAGDLVLSIDGFGTLSMDLVDVRDRIAGPRGSRVCLKMLRPLDNGTGIEYTIVLKRGAWGPEHAVVSPEDRDMIDKFRWPVPGGLSEQEFNRQSVHRHSTSIRLNEGNGSTCATTEGVSISGLPTPQPLTLPL
eukprot:CAMPEP_0173117894 /NCGR_PEP_ID=MMETSP1102-20130122/50622_1 /TAXON_ID=49646 /ORGANISM="Geminigera sp., Strain Caron Lab Isolate" /LENGTH=1021 /DNA_ID=CAMNT_0014022717 /DNA_START=44 /DNA_END=3109 /DNA_ORIENTATION=+